MSCRTTTTKLRRPDDEHGACGRFSGDRRPEAEPRREASYAIGLIEAMATELAAIRERLLSETRAVDGADGADTPRDGRRAS